MHDVVTPDRDGPLPRAVVPGMMSPGGGGTVGGESSGAQDS